MDALSWRTPTLARRIVLALLLAFALVWLVLMAYQFVQTTDQAKADGRLRELGANMLASLAPLENTGEARAVVAATSTLINNSYRANQVPGVLVMQLDARAGATVYVSPEGGTARLAGRPDLIDDARIGNQAFRVYRGEAGRWSLAVAAPTLAPWWILRAMVGELTIDMLIAFPLVLLPIWLAVRRGLRPLQQLSARIGARSPDQLAPLGVDPRYRELRPLAEALDQLLAQLRGKVEREHRFVQDAAHELRTPMAVIAAQAHVLALAPDPADRLAAERQLEQAIARASHLSAQLLALAQVEGAAPGVCAAVDLAQLARVELAMRAPDAMARGIELALEAPDVLMAALDVPAFQSVLQNLLSNAILYTRAGGQVVVGLRGAGAGLRLTVADDGPGIASAERERVFERFHRGGGHDAPGSGLGLAIVRQAAARLGGTVSLAEGLGGKGCTFALVLSGQVGSK